MKSEEKDIFRIGVLSDSHLPDTAEAWEFLSELVAHCFAGVDLILHAGDLVAPELLQAFGDCPVYAVRGNMDPASPDILVKRVVEVGGVRIGLIHGWGAPGGIEDRILAEFPVGSIDCLVYGHSHHPVCHHRHGILLFNPGSPTDRRRMAYHSVGLLEVSNGQVRGEIIRLD